MKRLAILVFIFLFAVYLHNLAPGWGAMSQFNTWDGLEYLNCAVLLGIDHPPGHPFYLLLGKLFTLLPVGEIAWRLNLLSAFFGALGVAVLSLGICEVMKASGASRDRYCISLAVSLAFGFSYVFWSHCEIPELHTLFLALAAFCIFALTRWHGGGGRKWLNAAAIALALSLGVNILSTCAFFVPVALFVLFSRRMRNETGSAFIPFAIFLSGLLLYLYYPIRISRWPVFSHPMNYLAPHEVGSASWYAWYISGKAWTGGQMFFLNRIITNIPLYLLFAVGGFPPWIQGLPLLLLAAVGVIVTLAGMRSLVRALLAHDRDAAARRLLGPFLLILFLFLLLPEISIHDPSNPRATLYLMNFFLPSLLILAFFGGIGAMAVVNLLARRSRKAGLLFTAALFAMPVWQYASNYSSCDLRGENSAYVLSKAALQQVPAGSVVVSKLVYPQVIAYFSLVEDAMPPGKVTVLDPEVISRELAADGAGPDLFARRNRLLLAELGKRLADGGAVFLAGDVVDEDKSPEKLLLSDLDFTLWEPALTPEESGLQPLRELFLYGVTGARAASVVKALPPGCERGAANDGRFANGIIILGFLPASPERSIRREVLPLMLFWKATRKVAGDIYVGVILLDERHRRVGEPCWHTLGGSFGASRWKEGEIVMEKINIFPPPLAPGRYYIAIGMVDERGGEVEYRPANFNQTGRSFDYVMLAPVDLGPVAY